MTTPESAPPRPRPHSPEPDTEHYWRATAEHRLLYRVDAATGELVSSARRPPEAGASWREAAGTGTIYTFTVIRQHGHPYFRGRVPYVVAYVDLDEGVRILTEIVAAPETVRIGQRVTVDWEDQEEVSVPVFRPAPA
jgi:uncharacterized OB-fold protein